MNMNDQHAPILLHAAMRDTGSSWLLALSSDITEVDVTDVLIRDVPDDVIAAVDAHARRLGLSRSEYVRRRLAQDAAVRDAAVGVEDLARFADAFSDLADPDVMSRAWR
jgi:Ribbon-helix-helix protein, copG family